MTPCIKLKRGTPAYLPVPPRYLDGEKVRVTSEKAMASSWWDCQPVRPVTQSLYCLSCHLTSQPINHIVPPLLLAFRPIRSSHQMAKQYTAHEAKLPISSAVLLLSVDKERLESASVDTCAMQWSEHPACACFAKTNDYKSFAKTVATTQGNHCQWPQRRGTTVSGHNAGGPLIDHEPANTPPTPPPPPPRGEFTTW